LVSQFPEFGTAVKPIVVSGDSLNMLLRHHEKDSLAEAAGQVAFVTLWRDQLNSPRMMALGRCFFAFRGQRR